MASAVVMVEASNLPAASNISISVFPPGKYLMSTKSPAGFGYNVMPAGKPAFSLMPVVPVYFITTAFQFFFAGSPYTDHIAQLIHGFFGLV